MLDELFFKPNSIAEWEFLGWSHSCCVTDLPQSTSLSNPEDHYSGSSSLLFRQLHFWTALPWEGWWRRITFTITAVLWFIEPGGILAFLTWYDSSARWTSFLPSILLSVLVLSKFISSFIFPSGYVYYWLFVAMWSQILVQVLIGWFASSILIFVVFMPIWTSWLWLDPIMMVWFVLSLKYDRRLL